MEKEALYNKINPMLNGIVGRLTMLRNTEQGKEAHEMALEVCNILDEWIDEDEV